MISVRENHVDVTSPVSGRSVEENLVGLSPDEIWKIVSLGDFVDLPRSSRPMVGPVLDWLRKYLWRLIGIKPKYVMTVMNHLYASSLAFREGTTDRAIFLNVVFNNEYRLPPSFAPGDIVIDIGMHIGGFCFAALLRGCTNIHGFEAERQNFNLAARNLQAFGERVHLYHMAVWRSDRTGDALYSGEGYFEGNTGGGCILYDTRGEKLDLIAFDNIIRDITNNGQKRIHLVKIDCEGSEFPILLTSRLLHLIDNIHGEYHDGVYAPVAQVEGVSKLSIAELTKHLQAAGFAVKSFPTPNSQLGMFFATRQEGALERH